MSITSNQDAVFPLRIYRGESKTYQLTVVDADENPVDLTGARVVFTVKETETSPADTILKDSDNGPAQAQVTDGPAGQAEIYLTPSDTAALSVRRYRYDVWVELSSGKRYVVVDPSPYYVDQPVGVIT